jgi:VanZ family protein
MVIMVLYFALSPENSEPFFDFHHADKIQHIIVFFILSFLLNRSSSNIGKRFRNAFALFFFGLFIELLQSFTGYRHVSMGDVLANFIGIVLFQVTYIFLKYLQRIKRAKNI